MNPITAAATEMFKKKTKQHFPLSSKKGFRTKTYRKRMRKIVFPHHLGVGLMKSLKGNFLTFTFLLSIVKFDQSDFCLMNIDALTKIKKKSGKFKIIKIQF